MNRLQGKKTCSALHPATSRLRIQQHSDGVKVQNTVPGTQVIHGVLIYQLVQQKGKCGNQVYRSQGKKNSAIKALRSQVLGNLSLPSVAILKQLLLVIQQFLYVA